MKRFLRISTVLALFTIISNPNPSEALVIHSISNLHSITFWELTIPAGSPILAVPYTFDKLSPELTIRRSDPLNSANSDFETPANEFYDVYYSNADGIFNPNGEFISVEAVFQGVAPSGGGLNISGIALNFAGSAPPVNLFIASFLALGNNAVPADVFNAIDGDLTLDTTMGNTFGQLERLRVTIGVTVIPEPSTLALFGFGALGLFGFLRKRRKA